MSRIPLALLLSTGLCAQTVHLVGPGGLAQISHAIAIAAPGDVVEVLAGNYLPFVLDKALTIRARAGNLVRILPATVDATRLRPPPGTVATISSLEFASPWTSWIMQETRIERGTVFCEDCVFEAPPMLGAGGLTVVGASAVLRRCYLVGNGIATNVAGTYNAGLVGSNAQVFASDCALRGSDTTFDSYGAAGEGALLIASTAHFVRCLIQGGTQRHCFASSPGAGIRTVGETRLWLADCTVVGGGTLCSGASGGSGLQHGATAPAQLERTAITGGVVGPTANALLLGLFADTMPLVRGQSFAISYRTQPSWPVGVFLAQELQPRMEPFAAEPVLLAGPGLGLAAVLVADGLGNAVFTTNVPAAPALQHARFFVQALAGLAPPFQTAPPLGGVVQ